MLSSFQIVYDSATNDKKTNDKKIHNKDFKTQSESEQLFFSRL